ncbi:MAG: hypothetical protein JO108_22910 [Acidobacteriaceae bacterium]|nr:hypothetical protein [Acidobacteriaceae bacterium]
MAAISHAPGQASTPGTARIMVNTFDGTRRLMPPGTPTLITVRDGWGTQQQ